MRRSPWARVTALFVGLWFVAVVAGPELTHACPTHGVHATAAPADAHAGHESGRAQVGSAHHATPDTESTAPGACTCLGHCCSTAPVGVVTEAIALVETTTATTRDAGLPDYAYVPVAARHVLPLAHAPPLSA